MHFVPSMKQFLVRPYLFMYAVLVFVLPFVFSRGTNELYEFPKTAFLYTVAIFVSALFLSDRILKPKKLKSVPLAVVIFLVSFVVSTAVSSDVRTSVFGYYSRFTDSLIFCISLFLLFYVAFSVFSKREFSFLFNVAHVGSIFLWLFALGQYFSVFDFLWGGRLQDRVFSTLGQPNWFAQYSLMLIGISLFEFLFRGKKIFFFFYFVQFFSLWLTFSVSGIVSFIILAVFYTFLLVSGKQRVTDAKRLKLRASSVVTITLALALLFPGIFGARIRDTLTDLNKIVERQFLVYAQTGVGGVQLSDPGYIRSGLWKGTLDMIFSGPKLFLFGSGPETFPYVFQEFRPLSLNYSSEWNYVFNKPHNYYLETWSEQGLIGLISHLILLVFAVKKVSVKYRGSLLVFIISNFFGWPTSATSVLFWLIVAETGAIDEID